MTDSFGNHCLILVNIKIFPWVIGEPGQFLAYILDANSTGQG